MLARSTICLEIGEDRVTGVELASGRIAGWFTHRLPRGMIRHGDPADPTAFGRELSEAMKAAGISARRARFAVAESVLLTRAIDLPRMRRGELARAVPYAVENEVPIPREQCVWAWSEVPGDRSRSPVVVIAGWRDVFERLVQAAAIAGVKVQLIEPRAASLARCVPGPGALVLDATDREARASVVIGGRAAYVSHAVLPPDQAMWPLVLERLLDNAADRADDPTLPVLLAGDLNGWAPRGRSARPIAGHIDHARVILPGDFQPGRFLVPLGLCLWTAKSGRGVRVPRPARRAPPFLRWRAPRREAGAVSGPGTRVPAQAGQTPIRSPVQVGDVGAPPN